MLRPSLRISSFFFNDTSTIEIYTLSLHDALPISAFCRSALPIVRLRSPAGRPWPIHFYPLGRATGKNGSAKRSEEHTSELQSRVDLVCRLLLEKKKKL